MQELALNPSALPRWPLLWIAPGLQETRASQLRASAFNPVFHTDPAANTERGSFRNPLLHVSMNTNFGEKHLPVPYVDQHARVADRVPWRPNDTDVSSLGQGV